MTYAFFPFGLLVGCIWQLLVFNMVFSLMLHDMYITLGAHFSHKYFDYLYKK